MKRLLVAGIALALAAPLAGLEATSASAQVVTKSVTERPNGNTTVRTTRLHRDGRVTTRVKHKWARGQRVPTTYRGSRYYVDYRRYKLRAPPRGYRWVRVDNDFLLIAATTGLIASVVAASQ